MIIYKTQGRLLSSIPLLIFAVSIAITYQLWVTAKTESQNSLDLSLQNATIDVAEHLSQKLDSYTQILLSVKALFHAEGQVSRQNFKNFIETQNISTRYPEIQSITFEPLIADGQKYQHELSARAEGMPDYQIRPVLQQDFYVPLFFIEPFDKNIGALGYDLYSNPIEKQFLEKARDLNRAVISDRVHLVQNDKPDQKTGYILYIPVYRHDTPANTIEQRRANLIGWVDVAFEMPNIFISVVKEYSNHFLFSLFDPNDSLNPGIGLRENGLLVMSAEDYVHGTGTPLKRSISLEIMDHKWIVEAKTYPNYISSESQNKEHAILVAGLVISSLLTVLAYQLSRSRSSALLLADKATLELVESEHRFRMMADASPVLIWMSDMNKRCIWFNQTWLRYTGKTLEQQIENGRAQGMHPEDYQRCLDIYNKSFDLHQPFRLKYRLMHNCGAYRWIDDQGSPRFDEQGNFSGYIGSCSDIHQQVIAHQALATSEERYRFAMDAAQEGLWDWNISTGHLMTSPRWSAMLGYHAEELPSHFSIWESLIHPEDKSEVTRLLEEHLKGESARYELEYRVLHKDGNWLWILGHGKVVLRDSADKPLRMVGANLEITKRKKAEWALNESESRMQLILKNVPAAISFWNTDLRIEFANPAYFT